jgi:uncharacterized metal-binding protein YceD (DUF177 family)
LKKRPDISEFDIYFANLRLGKQNYCYQLDSNFIIQYPDSLLSQFTAGIQVSIDKQTEHLGLLSVEINGRLLLSCERCLNDFEYPFQIKENIVLKLENTLDNKDDEIIHISTHNGKFNIAGILHEYLQEAIPIRKNCDMAGLECNMEMINLIDKYTIKKNLIDESGWDLVKNREKN